MQPNVNAEHGVDVTGRDGDTPDLVVRGKDDLFAIDLQRRVEHISRKEDQKALSPEFASFVPARVATAHQHTVVLLQGDQGIKNVNVDLAEVKSRGLAFCLPILATDLEERQVHGKVARFRQDICAGVPDGMVTTIKAHIVGVV